MPQASSLQRVKAQVGEGARAAICGGRGGGCHERMDKQQLWSRLRDNRDHCSDNNLRDDSCGDSDDNNLRDNNNLRDVDGND